MISKEEASQIIYESSELKDYDDQKEQPLRE